MTCLQRSKGINRDKKQPLATAHLHIKLQGHQHRPSNANILDGVKGKMMQVDDFAADAAACMAEHVRQVKVDGVGGLVTGVHTGRIGYMHESLPLGIDWD